ncbi:MAG: hypothetical protein Q9178_005660 [Gyalolechia marmorata]
MASPNPFLLLALAGFYFLWVNMFLNGTTDAFDLTTKAGAFPNGRFLLNSFTGWKRLDYNFATPVCFFDGMTNGSDSGTKLLYMDIVSTLHTAIIWFMLETLRAPNPKSISLLLPALWALLWNGFGAGLILPIPIYFHLQTPSNSKTPTKTIPLTHAKALLPAMTLTSYLTALVMFLSPILTTTVLQHQTILAWFQLAPLFTALAQILFATLISLLLPPEKFASPKDEHKESRKIVKINLLISAVFSAVIHVYCLGTSILAPSSSLNAFSRVYIPDPASMHANSTYTIVEGAFLFMRYDNIIISTTCALLCYMLLSTHLKPRDLAQKVGLAVGLGVATFVLGPGAVTSLAFWWREGKGVEERAVEKK